MRSAAQEERPQIITGERKAQRKKDLGPRALALLQVSKDGKRALIPIAILINGRFWDASAYKANPVPMSLESGTVYEAEQTGNSEGLFTVGAALHSNAANAVVPWLGTGTWLAAGAQTKTASVRAETVPLGIVDAEAPPRLTKNPQAAKPAPASADKASPPDAPKPAPASSSGDEPPRLKRPAESSGDSNPAESGQSSANQTGSNQAGANQQDTKGTPAPGTASADNKSDSTRTADRKTAETKPAGTKTADAKAPNEPSIPTSDSGTAEENRPRLRRGKPAQSFADEEIPGYSKGGGAPAAKVAAAKTSGAGNAVADLPPGQLIPAISDAGGPDPHPFTFEWLKDEEQERLQQMTALAKQQVQAYLTAQAKAMTSPAKMSKTMAARHVPPPKPPEPVVSNVQMKTFDLWNSNQPIMVFRADAQLPSTSEDSPLQYSVVIVARTDIYTNLRPLYSGITDKYHLDMTPRLELVDAVDADGDGRGELLFKETSDAGTGWVIYRATADKLWKMYDSQNPE